MPASPAPSFKKKDKKGTKEEKTVVGINLGKKHLEDIRILARGLDRSVSWTIRELIDASLEGPYSFELQEFKARFAEEDAINTPSAHQNTVASTPSIPQEPVTSTPSKQPIYFPPRDEHPSTTVDEEAEANGAAR